MPLSSASKSELIFSECGTTSVENAQTNSLTSIINYVDLLQKEDIDNEKVREYLDVLDRQSSRLKKLIQDLLEASKASTGSINVEAGGTGCGCYAVTGSRRIQRKIREK